MRFAALLPTAALVMLSIAACSKSVAGKYADPKDATQFIELRDDGTFFSQENTPFETRGGPQKPRGLSGTYRIDGEAITLTLPSGVAARGTIKGGVIVDDDKKVWVKE